MNSWSRINQTEVMYSIASHVAIQKLAEWLRWHRK